MLQLAMAYRSLWCLLFVMLVFLASEEMVVHVDGKLCDSNSHRFKGLCFSDRNCANVCRTEGFPGGHCKGFRRRCFCEKPC